MTTIEMDNDNMEGDANEYLIRTLNSTKPLILKRIMIDNFIPELIQNNEHKGMGKMKFESQMGKLEQNLNSILCTDDAPTNIFSESIDIIDKLCTLGYDDRLTELVENFLNQASQKVIICKDFIANDNYTTMDVDNLSEIELEEFLKLIRNLYDVYCLAIRRVISVLVGLEQSNRVKRVRYMPTWDNGIRSFRKNIFKINAVKQATSRYITSILTKQRMNILNGTSVENNIENLNNSNIKTTYIYKICQMVIDLGVYTRYIEGDVVSKTAKDYNAISKFLKATLPIQDYILTVQQILDYENLLSKKLLKNQSSSRLCCAVKESMIIGWLPVILNDDFETLIQSMNKPYITQLLFIYQTITDCKRSLAELSHAVNMEIRKIGYNCASDPNNQNNIIISILKLKSASDYVLKKCFKSNDNISKNIKDAFMHFSNQQSTHIVTHLVFYLDKLLTVKEKSNKLPKDLEALEKERISPVYRTLTLMKFIHSKDHFQSMYQKFLARRLLTNTYISIRSEKRLLKYIKTGFGPEVTHKMEGMIRDIEETQSNFSINLPDTSNMIKFDYKINVLTKNFWPPKFNMALILPQQLEFLRQIFEDDFSQKNSHKTLKWNPIYSDVILNYKLPDGDNIDLQICLIQACILLLFNKLQSITVMDAKKRTNITNDYYFNKALVSLTNFNGYSLVTVECNKGETTNNESFNPESIIRLNINLPSETSYINISEHFYLNLDITLVVPSDGSASNNSNDTDATNTNPQERIYQIDSSIMRIMKSVEKMDYQDLFDHTNAKLDFELTEELFQNRIKGLLDRDYLSEFAITVDGGPGISFAYVP